VRTACDDGILAVNCGVNDGSEVIVSTTLVGVENKQSQANRRHLHGLKDVAVPHVDRALLIIADKHMSKHAFFLSKNR
jgi:hypothetical protein